MREILFKAKRIDNGKWIEGYYNATREKKDVISPSQYGAFLQKRGKRK